MKSNEMAKQGFPAVLHIAVSATATVMKWDFIPVLVAIELKPSDNSIKTMTVLSTAQ